MNAEQGDTNVTYQDQHATSHNFARGQNNDTTMTKKSPDRAHEPRTPP